MIEEIRLQIQNEEFDYGLLMSALKDYKNPRNKVSSLLKQEKIMNPAIQSMLQKYPLQTTQDYDHALREILQELALCGLWRSNFFLHALFYGGTALRILHGLDRFSEDLHFSLLKENPYFNLESYGKAITTELRSWVFEVDLKAKFKSSQSAIQSAFLKTKSIKALLAIEAPQSLIGLNQPDRLIKIKIEIDTEPPLDFTNESKLLLKQIPFSVNTMSLPSLFAGKMHAVLCRA